MSKLNDKQGEPQKELRCDPKQLALLKKCSRNKDTTEWNKWREDNPQEEIWLQGSDLAHAYLKRANLSKAHLEEAKLYFAYLERAELNSANLKDANLNSANLKGANLQVAYLKGTDLYMTCLEETFCVGAHLEGAKIIFARLNGAELSGSYLEGAQLCGSHLEGTLLRSTHLKGADLTAGIVDGSTVFWECHVDRKTDFRGVGLETCRMDEKTKYLLQYNRRRMNCEHWYKEHPRLAPFAKAFFSFSDYGNSTWRIIQTFLIMATFFAIVYYIWGAVDYYLLGVTDHPGIVTNLFVSQHGPVDFSLVLLRSIYFSIVTMTTLGFGDMYANANNYTLAAVCGHLLLMLQVILGYVLLGALVTRFGVLFTSGLIPGEFKSTEDRRQRTENLTSDF